MSRNLVAIELKWKDIWKMQLPQYPKNDELSKKYVLAMFPYPSGALHMGHVRVYTLSDLLARYYRMQGHHTIHPMGWDAFGLPAENAARDRQIPAEQWTRQNIHQMRQQLDSLGFSFDWQREVITCNSEYYRWTQWIFLRLFSRGLAYRQEALVNWDPMDKTVLANEQVDAQGRSWRSGALVERRPLVQWYLRITAYQDRLVEGLQNLKWPEPVKEMQRNWILDREQTRRDQRPIYRLHDWLISRQRRWGTPIPIIHCPSCGTVAVPEAQLPFIPSPNPTPCPSCGRDDARCEQDTMDTFMDSSWYYWRHLDAQNPVNLADRSNLLAGLPVDVYIGGIEHAIMHLLYARFIHRFLLEEFKLSGCVAEEPFHRLITQGMVEGRTLRCPDTGRLLQPQEVSGDPTTDNLMIEATGRRPHVEWAKMSKSKYNGVDPVELVNQYGADVLRLCIIFKAPPEMNLRWNTREISGPQRWLVRLLNLTDKVISLPSTEGGLEDGLVSSSFNRYILQMNQALDVDEGNFKANLTVSTLMKFTNELEQFANMSSKDISKQSLMNALRGLAQMLHPLAPHTSAEILDCLAQANGQYHHPPGNNEFIWPSLSSSSSLESSILFKATKSVNKV